MYGAIWRSLPGPKWLKFIEALILIFAILFLLFQYAFPWVMENTNFIDNTVG